MNAKGLLFFQTLSSLFRYLLSSFGRGFRSFSFLQSCLLFFAAEKPVHFTLDAFRYDRRSFLIAFKKSLEPK